MKTILHIGLGKSGSTYIENNIFKKMRNSIYIDILSDELTDVLFLDTLEFNKKNLSEKIYTEKNKKENEYLLISCPGVTTPKKFDQFIVCDRLRSIFKDSMIILILRNQFEYITSYYRERVAGGAYISFPNFMKYCFSNYNASFLPNLNYFNLCHYYTQKFGEDNVKIFLYEELFDEKKNFNKNLFEMKTGINLNNIDSKSEVTNISIPFQLLGLRCFINRLYKYDNGQGLYDMPTRMLYQKKNFSYKYYYKLILNRIFKNKFFLKIFNKKINLIDRDNYDKINKLYGLSNSQLEKKFNINLKKNGYPFLEI